MRVSSKSWNIDWNSVNVSQLVCKDILFDDVALWFWTKTFYCRYINNGYHCDTIQNHSKVLKHYKENLNWFNYNYTMLGHRYLNRYVAINDKKIVESDRVLDELLERLKTNYHDSWYRFAIEFVDEEEPQTCLINDQRYRI